MLHRTRCFLRPSISSPGGVPVSLDGVTWKYGTFYLLVNSCVLPSARYCEDIRIHLESQVKLVCLYVTKTIHMLCPEIILQLSWEECGELW
jgi:hypothetical protein